MEPNRLFKRKIYSQLLKWKQESRGKSALLIEGARRIGKSTIVKSFAKNEYKSFIFIDFTKCSQDVKNLFNDTSNLDYIFLRLQLAYGVQLKERESLIVFDEVQFQPLARQAIKSFVDDHRYDYIETGSLISIRKNTENILIPSEEERISMYPMDYEEFRWALGDTATIPLLRGVWEHPQPLNEVHRKLIRDFRLYMLVGGMPQAVNAYLESNNFEVVDKAKRLILDLYDEDFNKIDPSGRASRIFSAIPAQLSSNASRYRISSVIPKARAEDYIELVSEMEKSRTVNVSHHCDDPNVGLASSESLEQYKMFVGDTGLFVTLAFRDKSFTENIIYERLLSDKLAANLGYLYENVVAQMLTASGNKLFYHTWPTESEKHNYEVDFLLSRGIKILPIEVKSSSYKTHASLDAFCKKYSSRIANERYLIYSKDYFREESVKYLPVYMAYFL
ncbi:MAG: ATP-binding protein [Paludibacteraceae bacterium]|nr:ATP-binding protein [Paludibacteraceae bacterium]